MTEKRSSKRLCTSECPNESTETDILSDVETRGASSEVSSREGKKNPSQVIRKILKYEIELEILQKWREVQVIEEELSRGRLLQTLIEKLVMNEYVYGKGGNFSVGDSIARPMTAGGFSFGQLSSPMARADSIGSTMRRAATKNISYAPSGSGGHGSNSSSKERVQTEPQAQYEVRPDGTIVRMRCPKCGAEQFRSMLGFLNHCRIHCRLTFSSQDERLQRCGVDPSEVPADYFQKHPSQLKQEMDLALIRADVLGPINDQLRRPAIHVAGSDPGVEADLTAQAEESRPRATPLSGSRYYVKRRIIIGNAAKCIVGADGATRMDETEGPMVGAEGNQPTHKWRLYLKCPRHITEPSEDLRSFIKGVRFFLHPNYRPKDIVDVSAPPFELVRTGWGEFPVRIQIHFWDPRNKPIEIVHPLRVVTVTSPKFVTAAEFAHDLDLDRRTDFEAGLQMSNSKSLVELPSALESAASNPQVSDEDVLSMCIGDFPLGGKRGKRAATVRYRPLASLEDFLRLDISEQRKHERNRADALCTHLLNTFHTFTWTVDQVVSWCREKGHTPASVARFVTALEESTQDSWNNLLFCRFCGLAHLPQDKFEVLQKNCSLRPRKIHVSSKTMGHDLLSNYELLPDTADAVKRLRTDYFGPTYIPYYEDPPAAVSAKMTLMEEKLDEATLMDVWTSEQIEELHLLNYPPNSKTVPHFATRCVARAIKGFAKHLIQSSLAQIPDSKERTDDRPVLLTPLHIYRAVCGNRDFDFLSNTYMLGGTNASGNGISAKEPPHDVDE